MQLVRRIRPGLGQFDLGTLFTDIALPPEPAAGTPDVSVYGLPASVTPDSTGTLWPAEVPPITPILPGITPGTTLSMEPGGVPYVPQPGSGVYTPGGAPSWLTTLLSVAQKVAAPKPAVRAPVRVGGTAASPTLRYASAGSSSTLWIAAAALGYLFFTRKRGRRR